MLLQAVKGGAFISNEHHSTSRHRRFGRGVSQTAFPGYPTSDWTARTQRS